MLQEVERGGRQGASFFVLAEKSLVLVLLVFCAHTPSSALAFEWLP